MDAREKTMDALIEELSRRTAEQEELLSVMNEGVVIISDDEKIVRMNEAAARCLDADVGRSRGRFLQEICRNASLLSLVAQILSSEETSENSNFPPDGRKDESDGPQEERRRIEEKGRILFAQGSALKDSGGKIRGAIIILHDQTRVNRLETMRRDFVANVSHELKTPITSIKGYLETLRDGALHDPENADRFLEITLKQADRLDAIIEDLLSLSRIEQDSDLGEIHLEEGDVSQTIDSVIQICRPRADAHRISLERDAPKDLFAMINPLLLEQAVVNLVDNAIKHSEDSGIVRVEAGHANDGVEIRVIDHGTGIPKEHLPRLFERFYRVDKARSRQQGGTGLGLAIVKHIAQAHGGGVDVKSEPGKGSVFTIRIGK